MRGSKFYFIFLEWLSDFGLARNSFLITIPILFGINVCGLFFLSRQVEGLSYDFWEVSHVAESPNMARIMIGVHNHGATPVVIYGVELNCPCLKVISSPSEVAQGAIRSILLEMDLEKNTVRSKSSRKGYCKPGSCRIVNECSCSSLC